MMAISVFAGYYIEMLVLFGIVIIHELGHATAAWLFGWKVAEIELLPFGGVALIEESDTATAWQEIVVALAGPLQNVGMIGASLLLTAIGVWDESWSYYFIKANMTIALFNLFPILPLDGGRILQALLSKYYSYFHTLLVCGWFSLATSVVIAVSCFLPLSNRGFQFNLLAIAGFLLFSNGYAVKDVYYRFIRFLMQREKRTAGMLRKGGYPQPVVVSADYRATEVAKLFKRERYHLIYVMDGKGHVKRIVPEERLLTDMFADAQYVLKYKEMSGTAGVER